MLTWRQAVIKLLSRFGRSSCIYEAVNLDYSDPFILHSQLDIVFRTFQKTEPVRTKSPSLSLTLLASSLTARSDIAWRTFPLPGGPLDKSEWMLRLQWDIRGNEVALIILLATLHETDYA